MRQVLPLGVFGVLESQSAFARRAEELRRLGDAVPEGERARVAAYLRDASPVIALMGYSEDVLEGAFSVVGGTAVLSDGRFFWRRDAAEYVERYGIRLPDAFMKQGREKGWTGTALSQAEILEIDDYFTWLRTPSQSRRLE
ncbi:hypothetical protein J8N05_34200 [Streptomyces sp. BH-SS-21]|uniref:Uncharacterized protein n=2 Tax=Streptomyces TaxID=1883 RepID=A0A940XWL5_9ACTN|nr:hypothetical protein [Streptomyces liliiviolaceus]MBQ0853219.1 hypothetical protein [Streptomyces liliiviolaceus]